MSTTTSNEKSSDLFWSKLVNSKDEAKLRLYYILQPHFTYRYLHSTHILLGFHAAQKAFLSTDTYQGQVYFTKGSFLNYVDKMRKVSGTENVKDMKIFTYN